MKRHLFLTFLLFSSFLSAQENDIEEIIQSLKIKIENSSENEKLKWMDSLSNVIAFDTSFENDSIVRATRSYAIAIDSFNIATYQTSNLLYYLNMNGESLKAKELYLASEKYLSKVSDNNIKSKFFLDAANTYFYLKELEKSLSLYDSVSYWANKENNENYMGRSKMGKGQVYTNMGNFGLASLSLQDAIRHFQKTNNAESTIGARNSLTILYSKNRFFDEAKKEREEIIKLSLEKNDYTSLPIIYYNAAADHNKLNNQKERIANLKLALEAAQLSNHPDYYEPIMLTGLVLGYSETDSLALAEKYLDRIENNKEKYTSGPLRTLYIDALKSYYLAKKDYPKAIKYGEEYLSIQKKGKQYEEIEFGEAFLYKLYQAIGNKEKAFEHYRQYTKIKDSIGNAQKVRVLSYYQTLYETEKRDLKIKAQESDIALLDTKSRLKNQYIILGSLGLFSVFGFVMLNRSRKEAKKRQLQQEVFTSKLLNTQEIERSRVAKELHDSVGQKLLLLKNTVFIKDNLREEEIHLLDETINEVREMSHNLHPFQFEKLGLIKSLENMISAFQKSSQVFYSSEIEDISGLIPKKKEIFIFRMLQECITNVEKHSEATACQLSVKTNDDYVIFKVKDNGKGFKLLEKLEETDSLGMKTLQERSHYIGAIFTINSKIGKGTTIQIKIPKS